MHRDARAPARVVLRRPIASGRKQAAAFVPRTISTASRKRHPPDFPVVNQRTNEDVRSPDKLSYQAAHRGGQRAPRM